MALFQGAEQRDPDQYTVAGKLGRPALRRRLFSEQVRLAGLDASAARRTGGFPGHSRLRHLPSGDGHSGLSGRRQLYRPRLEAAATGVRPPSCGASDGGLCAATAQKHHRGRCRHRCSNRQLGAPGLPATVRLAYPLRPQSQPPLRDVVGQSIRSCHRRTSRRRGLATSRPSTLLARGRRRRVAGRRLCGGAQLSSEP